MAQVRRLLLLEDEARLRQMLARALSQLPQLHIVEVGTLSDACEQLAQQDFDAILSDIDLPDGIGISLLDTLRRQGRSTPIVFMTAYIGVYGEQIPRDNDLIVLEKPFELDDMRTLIAEQLDVGQRKREAPFSLLDYIQISCMGQHSVEIELTKDGQNVGIIHIIKGLLWSAIDQLTKQTDNAGEDTLARMLFAEQQVHIQVRGLQQSKQQRNIARPWQALLLDLAREHDEAKADIHKTGTDDELTFDLVDTRCTPKEIQSETIPHFDNFNEAWESGVEALLEKRYREAHHAFQIADQLQPNDPRVQTNLQRLASMDIDRGKM